ncbi:MAG: aldehyde dehydrogenase family protein [Candidatus Aenigmarchaeota archaeon]|nr:aldehyde dehydrogenase family protein [Candidatus Aenigmarchaeota archaeon]
MKFTTINPATEEPIAEYEISDRAAVDEKVLRARKAFETWRETDIGERSKLLKKLGKRLLKKKQQLAESITEEMGKPLKESVAETEKCAAICEYFGKHARKLLKDEKIKTEFQKSYISFQPLGIVGSVMPWNFPASQIIRFAAPSLVAGNVQLVKPSSTTPNSGGLLIEQLVADCFPENVFQAVIGNSTTGTALIESKIDAVSLTGSVEAGAKIAQLAMKDLKKVILELGGSDPFIVLEDADMDKCVEGAVRGRFLNCGQSCTAAKRLIVIKEIADAFKEKFIEKTKALKVGDPLEMETDMGPLAREEQRKRLEEQLEASVRQGAKILLGGKRLERRGYFFEPTVVSASNEMTVCREEAFGPVAPIIIAESEEDAVRIANDTEYGLGASVWTNDRNRGEAFARKINSGAVYVNKNVRSDPRMPFGGTKKSGLGRELDRYGLLEMVNIKSVIIN